MTIPFMPSNAKEAACLDVVNKLVGPELLEGDIEVGPRCPDDAIDFVCERGMAATLELVQKNIDRLGPWRDIINQFCRPSTRSVIELKIDPSAASLRGDAERRAVAVWPPIILRRRTAALAAVPFKDVPGRLMLNATASKHNK